MVHKYLYYIAWCACDVALNVHLTNAWMKLSYGTCESGWMWMGKKIVSLAWSNMWCIEHE